MAALQGATAQAATPAARQSGGGPAQAAAPKPFAQASKTGTRLVGNFAPIVGAAPGAIGPTALTASGGYVKRYILESLMTGGGGTTPGVLAADAPWNEFALVTLTEPNNNPVLNLTGYNLYLTDIYGGYAMGESPANDPDYSAGAPVGNLATWPYIPIELDPTGLGALSDLSSSSGYQLYLLPNPSTTIFTTSPAPVPAWAVNVYAEFWTLPDRTDSEGNSQAIVPPRAGSIQMYNQILNIVLSAGGGNQEYQLNRMGNRLRTIIMVTRSSGARTDVVWPNPARVEWDDIILHNMSPQVCRKRMYEKVLSQAARPTGTFALFFNEGITRFTGGNGASSWLPTVVDTRFALSGQFAAATAPTLDWIVNDVSYAPLGAVDRTTVGPSGPGFHPGSTVGAAN
jgi:hypothetical protein